MKRILPGVHAWSVYNENKGLDFNGHLVANEEGCVLIDPPSMTEEQLQETESLGPPNAIVITNCHHTRDAMAFAARWRALILLPEMDAEAIPGDVRLGGIYRNGDRLPSGLLAVALADQKSPGESALLLESADAIILGDALIGKPPGSLSMLPPDKYADPAAARKGLRRLLEHQFSGVLVGDGVSLPEKGRAALEEFLSRDS